MRIDLHAHTTASDGTMTPTTLVRLAAERGVDVLGLTDHDTVAGFEEADRVAPHHGVQVVPGIEVSSKLSGRSVHVLGLFVDTSSDVLARTLERIRAERVDRARRMVERLNELGYALTFDEVLEHAHGDVVARPHVARALVARGYVDSVRDAFTPELIADGGRADVPREGLTPSGAVKLIRDAGGAAVLAHPGVTYHGGDGVRIPDGLIESLVDDGLAGVEVDHPDQPPDVRAELRRLAAAFDLVATGGSDFHGGEFLWPGTCTTDPAAFMELERRAAQPS